MNDQELRAIYDIVYAHECSFKAFAADINALIAAPTPERADADTAGANPGWLHVDEVKALCRDFSSRTGNVYIKDVESALDGLAALPSADPTYPASQERADAEKDAARYRWLRENCFDSTEPGDGDAFWHTELHFESEDLQCFDKVSLDSAIDAAIAGEKK
jgi:hypothetical protein